MSKKSFILLALIINSTICITLCIVLFTGTAGNTADNNIKNASSKENSNNIQGNAANVANEEESHSERPSNQAIVNIEDATIPSEENENGNSAEENNDENDSEAIVEMQAETEQNSDTHQSETEQNGDTHQSETEQNGDTHQSVTEQNDDSHSTSTETASGIVEDETEIVEVGGTIAYLRGGCNIRSYRNVADNIIGYANEGETYRIEPSQCTASWVAIYVDDTTIGYIAADFCHIEH